MIAADGWADLLSAPTPEIAEKTGLGTILFRQGRRDEAHTRFAAAEAKMMQLPDWQDIPGLTILQNSDTSYVDMLIGSDSRRFSRLAW